VTSTPARPNVNRAFLAHLARTTADAAIARTPVPHLRPATVLTSTDGVATVILDGDDGPVLTEVLVPEPDTDDRVMVLLQPPSGAFVVGYVGDSRARWGTGGGGGGGADEVWVSTAEPTPRDELLLWVDTDEAPPGPPVGQRWSPEYVADSGSLAVGAEGTATIAHSHGAAGLIVGHLEDGFWAHQMSWRMNTNTATQVSIKFLNQGPNTAQALLRFRMLY
jgi:hypothetical protein